MSKLNKLSSSHDLAEKVHEMLAEHNANGEKVFYYSEKEVKELCELASKGNFPSDTFEIWWETVKKK